MSKSFSEMIKEMQKRFYRRKGNRKQSFNSQILQRERVASGTKKKVISIDFSKAFDSVKRGQLTQTLVNSNVHPLIINKVTKIYTEDKTYVSYGIEKEVETDVTRGIRQGCTDSTTLYKLVTYTIIQQMEESEVLRMTSLR